LLTAETRRSKVALLVVAQTMKVVPVSCLVVKVTAPGTVAKPLFRVVSQVLMLRHRVGMSASKRGSEMSLEVTQVT
jgi:hypothetical protein